MSWFDVLEPGLLVQFVAIIIEGGKGKGGGGGDIDRVSCKMKWPFHFSRTINSAFHVSREKKTFLYNQFFLLWLRTTAKELLCSMSSPFSRFLFLVLSKGSQVLCLEVEALHHLLLIIVIRGVVIVFRELVCFRNYR